MKKQLIRQANMAYLEEGHGHPILMGHSFLWNAQMWQPQITTLQKNYRCIVPDLWSHGQSDPLPEGSCSLEILAEDYWQFTQALGLKKFTLMGLSVGGMWAAHLAVKHPEAVSALILMDTYLGIEPAPAKKNYLGMLDEMEQDNQITPAFADKVAPYFFAKNTKEEQPKLVDDFIQSLLNSPVSHMTGKVALGRAIFNRASLLKKLEELNVPTLIVVGEKDIPRPPQESQEMAELMANAQLEIVPKAGHICVVERPAYVNEILMQFLAR